MKADIEANGTLRIIPVTKTEETMLNIWFKDKGKTKINELVAVEAYEDFGPNCITKVVETAGSVDNLTADMKKAARKNIKAELDEMGVDYNQRAATTTLQKLLDRLKAESAEPSTEKQPGEETPPAEDPPAPEAPEEPEAPESVEGGTIDDVREALKKLAATKGTEKAKELLLGFKATKVSELKEEDYDAFLAKAEAVTNG